MDFPSASRGGKGDGLSPWRTRATPTPCRCATAARWSYTLAPGRGGGGVGGGDGGRAAARATRAAWSVKQTPACAAAGPPTPRDGRPAPRRKDAQTPGAGDGARACGERDTSRRRTRRGKQTSGPLPQRPLVAARATLPPSLHLRPPSAARPHRGGQAWPRRHSTKGAPTRCATRPGATWWGPSSCSAESAAVATAARTSRRGPRRTVGCGAPMDAGRRL